MLLSKTNKCQGNPSIISHWSWDFEHARLCFIYYTSSLLHQGTLLILLDSNKSTSSHAGSSFLMPGRSFDPWPFPCVAEEGLAKGFTIAAWSFLCTHTYPRSYIHPHSPCFAAYTGRGVWAPSCQRGEERGYGWWSHVLIRRRREEKKRKREWERENRNDIML